MKKHLLPSLVTLLLVAFMIPAQAQRSFIRNKIRQNIEKDMEKKHLDPQREKGREAIRDVSYENDTRYPLPENRVKATLSMQTQTYKKNGQPDQLMTSKVVFGPTGECMIMNEGKKEETRMLFDYEGRANYMINVKDKTAMKMPMINFSKMAKRMAEKHPDINDDKGSWKKTAETQKIHGYNCRKYIYNDGEGNHMDVWVTKDIHLKLDNAYLFGSSIKDFSDQQGRVDENAPDGFMVRNVYYEKGRENPAMQTDITRFDKSYDAGYFDLSAYEINDVLGKL